MPSVVGQLTDKGLIKPPKFLPANVQYEVMMGSVAYGVSDDTSDLDLYGWCIPPKDVVFPHLAGHIDGFGRQRQRFDQYQQHHIHDPSLRGGKGQDIDMSVYNIVKYFQLVRDCNPNMIDSLFVPQRCVLHCTQVGNMVREKRKLFLHRGAWFRFKGYAYSQKSKLSRTPVGKRKALVEKHGYDTKFSYHLVRLMCEVEQILVEGDLDLTRSREQLKSIRRGEWTLQQVYDWFETKEQALESVYASSKLPDRPDEDAIKQLLLECLEHHYGNLDACVLVADRAVRYLQEVKEVIERSGI
jgi:uncharacterized protein